MYMQILKKDQLSHVMTSDKIILKEVPMDQGHPQA